MAIGRISGQMLKANLLRSGTDLAFETNLLVLDVTNSRVGIGTASPSRQLHINGTGAIRLPSGDTAQRGTSANGDIRYNSELSTIEGYMNGAWTSLGGLIDADQDTFIKTELTADDDTLHFSTGGTDRMFIRANGDVEINNLKIANQTITGLATNADIEITPNGTGQVAITSIDVAAGEIDGTTIGANSAAAGTFTTLNTSSDAIIGGNLTVNGTTTTIDSVTLTIEDPLLTLAKNNSGGDANTYDQGLFMNRGSDANVSFFWDESADQFVFAVTAGEDGTTAGNITIDSYANIKANVITGADVETGSISAADGTESATIANSTGVMTIASSVLTTSDINGGTADGVTIGGSTRAAGSFTTVNANDNISIDADSKSLRIGAENDLTLTHDGTNSTIANATGNLVINGVASSSVVFNETGANIDFRVEGDAQDNLLVVDASADKIGIATATPGYILDIGSSTDAIKLPQGNTGARPTAATGIIRFNTETGKYEGCQDGSTYVNLQTEGDTPIISKVSATGDGSTYTAFQMSGDTPIISKVSTTGDGSTSTFTGFFAQAPNSVANVLVFIDNVYQEPTENYTVSSTNITFTSAPHSGARIFAIVGFDNTAAGTGGVLTTETASTNFTSSATTIMSFNATTYRSAEIFITTTDSANGEYEVAKANVVHNGTSAFATFFGLTSTTGVDLATYTVTLSGGSVLVQAQSAGGQQSAKVQYRLSLV